MSTQSSSHVENIDQQAALDEIVRIVRAAKTSSVRIANASTEQKNKALQAMSQAIKDAGDEILSANAKDVRAAQAYGLSSALLDRLELTDKRIDGMIESIEAVIKLTDPVGEVMRTINRPNGLEIKKVRVPLGVIGIIYESRPNVTTECSSLCLKSGNVVVLRGGSESFHSNQAIGKALQKALSVAGLPPAIISIVATTDRAGVDKLLSLDKYIDVIIPRGGEALIRKIVETSRIPVIKHAKGVCHTYIDDEADLKMAETIAINAKCQRPSTCNAMETLLVHEKIAKGFLTGLIARFKEKGVEIRGCDKTRELASGIRAATDEDWSAEYLDLVLAVKVVGSLDEAIAHIARYSSSHSEAIITKDQDHANKFLKEVDSSAVFVNASTRFSDGFEFGLGAEIGISTDRLHARGPMGLEELTTYKYVIRGSGQVRE